MLYVYIYCISSIQLGSLSRTNDVGNRREAHRDTPQKIGSWRFGDLVVLKCQYCTIGTRLVGELYVKSVKMHALRVIQLGGPKGVLKSPTLII